MVVAAAARWVNLGRLVLLHKTFLSERGTQERQSAFPNICGKQLKINPTNSMNVSDKRRVPTLSLESLSVKENLQRGQLYI